MRKIALVAILDDDSLSQLLLTDAVQTGGMDVLNFLTPECFLNYMATGKPDCVLLDMNMPGASGTEVLDELQRLGCDAPVIMVTGDDDVPTASAAYRNGAKDFVVKPVDSADLLERVLTVLSTDRTHREQPAAKRI